MMAAKIEKKALRTYFLNKRKEFDPGMKKDADIMICSAIRRLPEYKSADRVLVYSPIRNEIDLRILLEYMKEDGKSSLFPRCFGEKMRFADTSYDRLQSGSYGILEPSVDAKYVDSFASTDICILPCLCADRRGYRLGYGGGYYDRFLADFPGIKIIAVYSDFVVDECISECFDIAADIVVTEKESLRI
jgi:5-formyltetrahydrofolate cyclo-ligase